MSKSKFMSHLSERNKILKKRRKGFCSIVDQVQDLFLGHLPEIHEVSVLSLNLIICNISL